MSATAEHHASSVASTNIEVDAAVDLSARQRLALRDLADGSKLWRLAVMLGWLDIKLRYRGSVIGPFWLTLSTAVQIGAMGAVYGTLFHQDLHEYLPFLAVSLVMWSAVTAISGDACTTFVQADATIRSMRMPYFVHVVRVQVRTVLTLLHNLPVLLVVGLIYHAWPGMNVLAAVPALALWLVDGIAACLLLGSFCARFRDVPPIVGSIMQIAFFITPIVWKPEQLGRDGWWLPYNPFYALLQIVRGPMLGHLAGADIWLSAMVFSVVLSTAAWLLFVRVRGRIAFWI